MGVDWNIVVPVIAAVVGALVGQWLRSRLEKRPNLVYYYSSLVNAKYQAPNNTMVPIYTHSLVIFNSGKQKANNVRISHIWLPNFDISPATEHRVEKLLDESLDIVISQVVPGETLTISYVYFVPRQINDIHGRLGAVKSDEGYASLQAMQEQILLSPWMKRFSYAIALVGLGTVIYMLIHVVIFVVKMVQLVGGN